MVVRSAMSSRVGQGALMGIVAGYAGPK
jgi:uncharacterized membrane protein (Fun14 family)